MDEGHVAAAQPVNVGQTRVIGGLPRLGCSFHLLLCCPLGLGVFQPTATCGVMRPDCVSARRRARGLRLLTGRGWAEQWSERGLAVPLVLPLELSILILSSKTKHFKINVYRKAQLENPGVFHFSHLRFLTGLWTTASPAAQTGKGGSMPPTSQRRFYSFSFLFQPPLVSSFYIILPISGHSTAIKRWRTLYDEEDGPGAAKSWQNFKPFSKRAISERNKNPIIFLQEV